MLDASLSIRMAVTGCQPLTSKNGDASEVPDVDGVDSECRRESISVKQRKRRRG